MDPAKAESEVVGAEKSVHSRLPIYSVKTLGDQLDDSLVEERLVASLSGVFGFMAMLLTCIGLYGLMAYLVYRRTGEIGIRMALGAERNRIARMIVGETMMLVVIGVADGVPAAMLASQQRPRHDSTFLSEYRPGGEHMAADRQAARADSIRGQTLGFSVCSDPACAP